VTVIRGTSALHHGTRSIPGLGGGSGRIRTIGYRHARAVGELLAAAFHDENVTRWLAPDVDARPATMAGFFTAMATSAFTTGSVDVLLDRYDVPIAAGVWLDHTAPASTDSHDELAVDRTGGDGAFGLDRPVTDPSRDPWTLLDQAMTASHPTRPHEYLMLLGVHPAYQGQGLGTRLLTHHHTWLDATGTAAYLEATSAESRALYARLGYDDHGDPIHPAGASGVGGVPGPTLWPMWRPSGSLTPIDRDGSPRPQDGPGLPGSGAARVLRWVS